MFEFLGAMIAIPLWFPALFIVLSLGFFTHDVWNIWQTKKWNPEGHIFITARKKGNPVLRIHALNGFFKFVLGEKEKKGSPVFKHDAQHLEGIRFDPRLQSGAVPKSWTVGGLEMLDFSTSSPFALSANNALAMKTVLEYTRENYPVLDPMPDQLVLEYAGRDRADLPHDCRNLAEVFDLEIFPEKGKIIAFSEDYESALVNSDAGKAMSEDEIKAKKDAAVKDYILEYRTGYLTKVFQAIQDETLKLPIKSNRFFSFTEAFQNISSAFSAVDIQTFLQLFEMLAKLNDEKNFERILMMITAIGFAVLLVLVGVYVVGLGK